MRRNSKIQRLLLKLFYCIHKRDYRTHRGSYRSFRSRVDPGIKCVVHISVPDSCLDTFPTDLLGWGESYRSSVSTSSFPSRYHPNRHRTTITGSMSPVCAEVRSGTGGEVRSLKFPSFSFYIRVSFYTLSEVPLGHRSEKSQSNVC